MNIAASSGVNFQSSFYNRFFESLPNKDIKNPAAFNKMGQRLASPHWNRLAIGLAAITTQPFLDYFNPRVDKDTAKASALRTISKIIVCTSVGFAVRGSCYKLTNKFMHASAKEGSIALTPAVILNEKNPEIQKNMLKLHRNTFSTVFALGVMLFTNVFVDAPLTTILSNKLISAQKARQNKDKVVS